MNPVNETRPGVRRAPTRAGDARVKLAVAPRVSLGDVVADSVRQAILNAELSPGERLREEDLSEQLQVSRGPVRDAFILLEREGLVRLSRHRGASVVELSAVDLGEVYSLRSAIEGLAVRLAIRRHVPEDLEAMARSLTDQRTGLRRNINEKEAARLDVEFHDVIFRAAHHERLYGSWSAIRTQVFWFLCRRNIASGDWRVKNIEGHTAIVELIRAGNENQAGIEIQRHIRTAYARIIATAELDNAQADPQTDARRVAQTFLLD